jgi:hypothetical protein
MRKIVQSLFVLGVMQQWTATILSDSVSVRENAPAVYVTYTNEQFRKALENARAKVWRDVHEAHKTRFRHVPFDTFSTVVHQYLSPDAVTKALGNLNSDEKRPDAEQSNDGDIIKMARGQLQEIVQQIGTEVEKNLQEKEELYVAQMKHDAKEQAKENNRAPRGWFAWLWFGRP